MIVLTLLGDDGERQLLVALEIVELQLEGGVLVVVTARVVGVLYRFALGKGIENAVVDDLVVLLVLNLDGH